MGENRFSHIYSILYLVFSFLFSFLPLNIKGFSCVLVSKKSIFWLPPLCMVAYLIQLFFECRCFRIAVAICRVFTEKIYKDNLILILKIIFWRILRKFKFAYFLPATRLRIYFSRYICDGWTICLIFILCIVLWIC